MSEQAIIEQLQEYRKTVARIKALESYSVGNGITISRLSQDDHLQQLHRKLKGQPSYLYLNKHEQRLEAAATAYMTHYPAGLRAQREAIPVKVIDEEDRKLLQEVRGKIKRVIKARAGEIDNYDTVLERLSELQDLIRKRDRVEQALDALSGYEPEYAAMLRLRYVERLSWSEIGQELFLAASTCYKRHKDALDALSRIAG